MQHTSEGLVRWEGTSLWKIWGSDELASYSDNLGENSVDTEQGYGMGVLLWQRPLWPQSTKGEKMRGTYKAVSVAQQYQVLIRSKKFLGLDNIRPSEQQMSVKMARKQNSRFG